MKKNVYVLLGILMVIMMSSCVAKKVVLVEDMKVGNKYPITTQSQIEIKKNDRLGITVSSKIPTLAIPFNQRGGYNVTVEGEVTGATNVDIQKGYLVDQNGKIEFPVLGEMKVEGLTRKELENKIKDRLIQENLINDPIVTVDILNMKITVMGEFGSIGVLDVPDGKITLLEVIAKSGGLTSNAVPNKVAVIREENGSRKIYMNDVRTKDIFNSPVYYLQQNDIVYATPKAGTTNPKVENNRWWYSSLTGLISLAISIYTVTLLYDRD